MPAQTAPLHLLDTIYERLNEADRVEFVEGFRRVLAQSNHLVYGMKQVGKYLEEWYWSAILGSDQEWLEQMETQPVGREFTQEELDRLLNVA
jgi:hypothetical protein